MASSDENRHEKEILTSKRSLWTNCLVGLTFITYGCAMLTFPSDFRMCFGVFVLTVLKAALPIATIISNFTVVQATVDQYLKLAISNCQNLKVYICGVAVRKRDEIFA